MGRAGYVVYYRNLICWDISYMCGDIQYKDLVCFDWGCV